MARGSSPRVPGPPRWRVAARHPAQRSHWPSLEGDAQAPGPARRWRIRSAQSGLSGRAPTRPCRGGHLGAVTHRSPIESGCAGTHQSSGPRCGEAPLSALGFAEPAHLSPPGQSWATGSSSADAPPLGQAPGWRTYPGLGQRHVGPRHQQPAEGGRQARRARHFPTEPKSSRIRQGGWRPSRGWRQLLRVSPELYRRGALD